MCIALMCADTHIYIPSYLLCMLCSVSCLPNVRQSLFYVSIREAYPLGDVQRILGNRRRKYRTREGRRNTAQCVYTYRGDTPTERLGCGTQKGPSFSLPLCILHS